MSKERQQRFTVQPYLKGEGMEKGIPQNYLGFFKDHN